MSGFRLRSHAAAPVPFTWQGREMLGAQGDTLAAALLVGHRVCGVKEAAADKRVDHLDGERFDVRLQEDEAVRRSRARRGGR